MLAISEGDLSVSLSPLSPSLSLPLSLLTMFRHREDGLFVAVGGSLDAAAVVSVPPRRRILVHGPGQRKKERKERAAAASAAKQK